MTAEERAKHEANLAYGYKVLRELSDHRDRLIRAVGNCRELLEAYAALYGLDKDEQEKG